MKSKNITFNQIEEVLSYLPEVAKIYDSNKTNKSFSEFASIRLIMFYIDELRLMNKKHKKDFNCKKIYLIPDPKFSFDKNSPIPNGLKKYISEYNNSDVNKIDENDLVNTILSKVNKSFKDDKNVYKVLIEQYLVPKFFSKEFKTLNILSKEVGLSQSRLSTLIRSKKMKKFFEFIRH